MSSSRRVILIATLSCTSFLDIFAVQANVLVWPQISHEFDIAATRQQWIASAYNVAFGSSLLFLGRVADIYGRRMVFVAGALFLALVTLTIPFSPNEAMFDSLRALQGLGAAATVPSAVGILGVTFPPGKWRNYAFVAYSGGMASGSVIGNLVGGVVGGFLGWKWVFWFVSFFAALLSATSFALIPDETRCAVDNEESRLDLDWLGALIISGSLVMLLYALSEGNVIGWGTPMIPSLIAASLALMVAFYFWQRHLERNTKRAPLVRVSMFRDTQFTAAFVAVACFFASFSSYFVFVSLFYEEYQGLSVLDTTLMFIPSGVSGCIACIFTGQLLSRVPGFYLLLATSILATISPLLFAVPIPPDTTYWAYGFLAMCLCFSVDIFAPTINLFIVERLPEKDQSLGGGLINTANQLGRAFGLAIATAAQSGVVGSDDGLQKQGNDSVLSGLRAAEWVLVASAITTSLVVMGFFRGMAQVGLKNQDSDDGK
ncbi:major facilitator superfamily [Pseudomassariella vexata]|uniref:Major facilitator superfamily n=1 Tax=Pseudomassariella vexata TaxID=1141098 RepID=A0A1Y2DHF8_9PEZI|nr:major facilitator superfamily [Pseudomassariella vexata]ORY58185.1 major facilitator superfamily [Pseudomassariella vexata]